MSNTMEGNIDIDHISHSQLELYDKCARAWEFRYIKQIRTPSSPALVLGDCYHRTIESNFKFKLSKGEDIDLDFIPDIFKKHWDTILANTEIIWDDENPTRTRDIGISLACKYVEDVAPTIYPEYVERWIESEIAGVKFVIRIDLIDMHSSVIDHKTANKRYNQKDVDNDMQASACAFALKRPVIFYNHVAVKTMKSNIQILKTYRTQDDINWWVEKAEATINVMKSGYYPPRTQGWYCDQRYCDFYDRCRGHLTKVFIG